MTLHISSSMQKKSVGQLHHGVWGCFSSAEIRKFDRADENMDEGRVGYYYY